MTLSRELEAALRLAREAGALALRLQRAGVRAETKDDQSPVTAADRAADVFITTGLRALFPGDAVLSEEAPDDGLRLSRERVWMVDPIDGTKDFIRNESGYATMIGLCQGERPVLGVVFQPTADRIYWATRAGGAFTQVGQGPPVRLRVSEVRDVSAIRMVASKSHRDQTIDQVRAELGITDELNLGSVGLKLGLIARGERDLYVNPSGHSKLWDTCGPEAILVEAGGRVTDGRCSPLPYRAAELRHLNGLIASNGHVHDEVAARLAPLLSSRPS